MGTETTRTFEARIQIDPTTDQILHDCAKLLSHIEHRLFADISSGKTSTQLKNSYLARYQITARHFNAIRVKIEGKIASIKVRRPALIVEAKERISSLTKKIKHLTKVKPHSQILHQKKRRLGTLEKRVEQLEKDHKEGIVRCCFGSKKLFRAQFNLEENGYASHEEWLKTWKHARASELFFLGSKDETAGNQTCTATVLSDETIQLRIRLPDALKKDKYLILSSINFKYGKKELLTLLNNQKQCPQAISWRLKHDEKGWRVFATFDILTAPCTSNSNTGVIGLDINVDHLALSETDRHGNPILKKTIPFNLYGKNTHQARAIIGDVAALAVTHAEKTNKPLIIEDLDFQRKKTSLRENSPTSQARLLSSFAYHTIITHLKSRASKQGVLLNQVNPAYSSVIGRVKFAKRHGLSIHHAAALTIGRRHLRFSEKAPSSRPEIPDGKNGHVTFSLPARTRGKHVWSFWRQVSKKMQTALAAHFRTAKSRSKSSSTPAPETEVLSKVVGGIPTCESSEVLFT